MEFHGKKLEDLIITLPFADGTEEDYGVFASFEMDSNTYFVLQPLLEDKRTLDKTKGLSIYRVSDDGEGNPCVEYIENDFEYQKAVGKFQYEMMKQK